MIYINYLAKLLEYYVGCLLVIMFVLVLVLVAVTEN